MHLTTCFDTFTITCSTGNACCWFVWNLKRQLLQYSLQQFRKTRLYARAGVSVSVSVSWCRCRALFPGVGVGVGVVIFRDDTDTRIQLQNWWIDHWNGVNWTARRQGCVGNHPYIPGGYPWRCQKCVLIRKNTMSVERLFSSLHFIVSDLRSLLNASLFLHTNWEWIESIAESIVLSAFDCFKPINCFEWYGITLSHVIVISIFISVIIHCQFN